MAKKKMRQLAFRAPEDLAARLEKAASRLGLDLSNFLRMMAVENVARYERRADQVDRESQEDG